MALVHHCPHCWERRKESRGWLPGQLGPRGGGPETQTRQKREQDPSAHGNPAPRGKGPRTLLGKGKEQGWPGQGRPPVLETAELDSHLPQGGRHPGMTERPGQSGRRAGGIQGPWWMGPREQDPGQREEGAEAGNASGRAAHCCCCLPPPCTAWLEGCRQRPGVQRGRGACHLRFTQPCQQPALAVRSPGIRLPQGV